MRDTKDKLEQNAQEKDWKIRKEDWQQKHCKGTLKTTKTDGKICSVLGLEDSLL